MVQCYRIAELDFTGLDKVPEKVYPPKPENCLHFMIEGNIEIKYAGKKPAVYSNPVLVGQQTQSFIRSTPAKIVNFQIVFQSSGVYQLLGIPAYELSGLHVDAAALFGPEIASLLQQFQDAKTHTEILTLADVFVMRRMQRARKNQSPFDALTRSVKDGQFSKLNDLVAQSSLSSKQFNRKFIERVGLNPKLYMRIARFNKAFNIRNRFPKTDWLTLALACDYYDYQHLAKDYREFTGVNPNQFHAFENRSPESVLGLASALYQSRSPLHSPP